MIALVSRRSTVLIRESFGGVTLHSRSVLISTSNYGKEDIFDDKYPVELPHDPWPLSDWIYGDGWKGYRMLLMPNLDTTTTWTIETSKKLLNETSNIGKDIYKLSNLDSKTICLLFVDKSKQSLEVFVNRLSKTKDETVDLVKSGKVKELASNSFQSLKSLSDTLNDLIVKNFSENGVNKSMIKATSDKNAGGGGDCSNSCQAIEKSSDVYKTDLSKSIGETFNKIVRSNKDVYLTISSLISRKYFSNDQFKYNSRSREMLYIDKCLGKTDKVPKREYHCLAYVSTRILSQPQLSLNPYRSLSKIETGEFFTAIPDSVKKLWQKLRDNKLQGWQATIASILQKIQDSLIKKKK